MFKRAKVKTYFQIASPRIEKCMGRKPDSRTVDSVRAAIEKGKAKKGLMSLFPDASSGVLLGEKIKKDPLNYFLLDHNVERMERMKKTGPLGQEAEKCLVIPAKITKIDEKHCWVTDANGSSYRVDRTVYGITPAGELKKGQNVLVHDGVVVKKVNFITNLRARSLFKKAKKASK